MNANAQKWIDALRSDKYKQCRRQLHSNLDDSYCALGVAMAIAAENGVLVEQNNYTYSAYLPDSVRRWLGVKDSKVILSDSLENPISVVYLNDSKLLSFSEIADQIEKYPEAFGEIEQ